LRSFVEVFELDPFLVAAAPKPAPLSGLRAVNYRQLIGTLAAGRARRLSGPAGRGRPERRAGAAQALAALLPQERAPGRPAAHASGSWSSAPPATGRAKRQAEEAHKQHVAAMQALAAREPQTWQQVEDLLERGRRIASVYDEATELLAALQDLAEFGIGRRTSRVACAAWRRRLPPGRR
jgi:hypothetical protein